MQIGIVEYCIKMSTSGALSIYGTAPATVTAVTYASQQLRLPGGATQVWAYTQNRTKFAVSARKGAVYARYTWAKHGEGRAVCERRSRSRQPKRWAAGQAGEDVHCWRMDTGATQQKVRA